MTSRYVRLTSLAVAAALAASCASNGDEAATLDDSATDDTTPSSVDSSSDVDSASSADRAPTTTTLPATTTTTTTPAVVETAPPTIPPTISPTTPPTTVAPAEPEWITHRGDPDDPACQCADGSEHTFSSVERDPDRVLLYFEGGGACFSAETCNFVTGTYKVTAQTNGRPSFDAGGIFEWDRSDNPFADWSVVYVPYCSGDVFVGNAEHEYGPDLTVQHRGSAHARTALDFVASNFAGADRLFVTGSSAGGVPTPLIGGLAADLLPNADITVLADASGGYASRPGINGFVGGVWGAENGFPDWPEFEGLGVEDVGIPDLFPISGRHAPGVAMARFDNAHDEVQTTFAALAGGGIGVQEVLDENEQRTEAAGVNLDVYIAPGTDHTILGRDELYTLEVEGVTFLDWLTALVNSQSPGDVRCIDCGEPIG